MNVGDIIDVVTSKQAGIMPGDLGIIEEVLSDGYSVKIQVRAQNAFGGMATSEPRTVFFEKNEIKLHSSSKKNVH